MKLILIQPANLRFQWELEVLLTNVRQFSDMEVVLLFSKASDYNAGTAPYLKHKYRNVTAYLYEDNRMDKSYIPSIRPYLWWQYLKGHPERENETYFYIDSDVIFREWPKVSELGVGPNRWAGSSCDGYINYDYIKKCDRGDEILARMAEIAGIRVDQMVDVPGIGAQMVIGNPTAVFWERAYKDTMALWRYFGGIDSNIQKWTAEMWAQLWLMVANGIEVVAPKELDFCMATDDIAKWNATKIMHNNGVTSSANMFFKGQYTDHTPFGGNFDHVDKTKCSRKYVDALEKVIV